MPHLEGVLTLVNASGPWFRVQGRHERERGAHRVGVRMSLSPHTGITVDVHLGRAAWVRAGWYPAHRTCLTHGHIDYTKHQCWGRWLSPWVYERGLV